MNKSTKNLHNLQINAKCPLNSRWLLYYFVGKTERGENLGGNAGGRLEAPNLWRFGYNSICVQLKLG